jgi:hypothetical protein
MSTETQTRSKNTAGVRKKPFAVPPVKVACLSWCVEYFELHIELLLMVCLLVVGHLVSDVMVKSHVQV